MELFAEEQEEGVEREVQEEEEAEEAEEKTDSFLREWKSELRMGKNRPMCERW